jgi:hypothetical protein
VNGWYYILGPGNVVVPTTNLLEWARFMERGNRIVAKTLVAPGVEVSTVFLGSDHNFGFGGGPVLFETMIFDDYEDGHQWRWRTWDEAVQGHESICELIRVRMAITIPEG